MLDSIQIYNMETVINLRRLIASNISYCIRITGVWLLYDGQLGFQTDGMVANYIVRSCKKKKYPKNSYKKKNRRVIKLYIAAVEIDWDYIYIPRKLNTVTMTSLNDPST